MTKKPSEKNKAWEKDRRDRLNKTFDELAKLLPKYDASIVWSKIEIIQKAIAFVTELQSKHEDYLKAQDPKLFKEYEDFVNCIKFYQERNAQLTELLKKAKVALPPVVLPPLLVKKPELQPNVINPEAVCLQKPKRQRTSARRNDAVAKKSDESEEVQAKSLSDTNNDADSAKNVDKQSEPTLTPKVDTQGDATDKTHHDAAFKENPPQENMLPPAPPPPPPLPAKPIFVRLRKGKTKMPRKPIRRPVVRKCYPHPEKLLSLSGQCIARRKIDRKHRRISKRKFSRKECRKKERKLGSPTLPLREQTVSPTAAFLLSFPVVTSSAISGKNVENVESAVSLENLNNFFTSDEYNQFCDQNSASDVKLNVIAIASLPLEPEEKVVISSKPVTSFSVSAITRPCSPKKRSELAVTKRTCETDWVVGNKFIRGFDDKNAACVPSYNQQSFPAQQSLPTAASTECLSFSTQQAKLSTSPSACTINSQMNRKAISTLANSVASVNPSAVFAPNTDKKLADIMAKTPNIGLNAASKQLSSAQNQLPVPNAVNWDVKTTASNKPMLHNPGVPVSKNISHVVTGGNTKTQSSAANETISKASAKTSANSFYSPAKSFFYEFSPPNQPVNSFNFSRPAVTSSSSQSDPLFSSTITTKSQTFLSFPSIKPEFPWLQPCTTAFTMSLTSTTATTTTTAPCNSNAVPFDLGSVVSESLPSTSFTMSLSTSKSFDAAPVDTGNKQITDIKCINQANIFPSCDDLQFTPRVTSSLAKQANSQVNATTKEMTWKQEKAKDLSDQIFYDCEQSKMQQKTHVNWMTSTGNDFSPTQAAVPLPPIDFVNQCPTSTTVDFGFGCRKDSYDDDNQFINWSPTKPLNTDFSAAYTFENFGSSEAPPNKTVKQIFSVSQLVDQTPSQESPSMKKTVPKTLLKSAPAKQTFSNIYSAESLIAKKDNHRMSNATSFYNQDTSNTQTDYHNMSNYIYSYPNTQTCLQPENDYLGASAYATSSTVKTTSILPSTGVGTTATAPAMPPYESSIVSSSNNYFGHSNAVNTNDPYDPTYFPSNNYNHPAAANWNPCTTKGTLGHSYNQSQVPLSVGYGAVEGVCQQNSNVSGNLTNFNLSSICPEIDGKHGSTGW